MERVSRGGLVVPKLSTPLLSVIAAVAIVGCGRYDDSRLDDEALQRAKQQNRTVEDAVADYTPRKIDNYFAGMDGIVALPEGFAYQLVDKASPALLSAHPQLKDPIADAMESEVFGRNTWMLWAGGNEGFWDWLSTTFGFIDLLKLVETPRDQRFAIAGLINEPAMERRGSDEFGLSLDVPSDPEVAAWRRQYVRLVFHLGSECSAAPSYAGGSGYSGTPGPGYGGAAAGGGYGTGTGYAAGDVPQSLARKIPPPGIYGLSSGVVGLRLFPNPNFDAEACKAWSARKYHDDPVGDPNLVRPYRVAMSCAFCHASWHPLNPPPDMKNPRWENISGNIGAQYLRPLKAFGNLLQKDNFIYHLLDSQPPGTIDTSLIASDNINNPNTMNAVFNLPQRAVIAFRNVRERQGAASRQKPSLWSHPEQTRPDVAPYSPYPDAVAESVATFFDAEKLGDELRGSKPGERDRRVSRILLDGADSIGAWGALARVYLNIGTNWEQWNSLHAPVVGFRAQKPFTIANTERHSVYWQATERRVPALRDYFLAVTSPMPLLAATDTKNRTGAAPEKERHRYLDVSKLAAGRKVFAHHCITCHSSIQPDDRQKELNSAPNGEYWDRDPGRWLTDPVYRDWAEKAVETPEFWRKNYLSTDMRIAVNFVGTNSCRAMATNAMNGHMWQDFASDSYRSMPSVGNIPFFNPYKGERGGDDEYLPSHRVDNAPAGGGGPGFYRVPTLVSIWATAPFLHNNSLGLFNNDPSVDGRLDAFDDAIRKLLSPAKRLESSSYDEATPARLKDDHGLIWRTTTETYITLPGPYLPRALGSAVPFIGELEYRYPWLMRIRPAWRPVPAVAILLLAAAILVRTSRFKIRLIGYLLIVLALVVGAAVYFFNGGFGGLRVGPIPKGVPVNLLANINPEAGTSQLLRVGAKTRDTLTEIASSRADQKRTEQLLRTHLAPELMTISKCPDFVMDRGHYFEWFTGMTDADKDALIELLKTF